MAEAQRNNSRERDPDHGGAAAAVVGIVIGLLWATTPSGSGDEGPRSPTGLPDPKGDTEGWQAYRVENYVNWCGHAQEIIPVPRPDGLVAFLPVLGEAT